MGYSLKHKVLILQKVLPPNNRPVHEVSKDSGISVQTIYKWINQAKEGTLPLGVPDETIPRFKSDLEKFSLILESKTMPENQLGEWLRKNGLHGEHLTLWETELAKTMSDKKNNIEDLKEMNITLKKTTRYLKRNLMRRRKH